MDILIPIPVDTICTSDFLHALLRHSGFLIIKSRGDEIR